MKVTSVVTPDSPAYTLMPNITDTGSFLLGDSTGLSGCGNRLFQFDGWTFEEPFYKKIGLSVVHNANNTYSLALNPKNEFLIGTHKINVTVSLDQYWVNGPKLLM